MGAEGKLDRSKSGRIVDQAGLAPSLREQRPPAGKRSFWMRDDIKEKIVSERNLRTKSATF